MIIFHVLLAFQFLVVSPKPETVLSEPVKINDYTKIDWSDLANIKFEDRYSKEMQQFMPYPIFDESIKVLDGMNIMIEGYVIPLEATVEQTIIVLSANPFSACFFCGAAGPETVMDVKLADKMINVDMDERVTLKGKLNLNSDDIYSLYYILTEAELAN